MEKRRQAPGVNAGSLADIAFLLLIFFLVTTVIQTEMGLDRMLPGWEDSQPPVALNERNVLEIVISGQNKLMVGEDEMDLKDLRNRAIAFLDNGGASKEGSDFCDYCRGQAVPEASDNPQKAVISVRTGRHTHYGFYIAVQNELVAAYHTLRDREAQRIYGQDYTEMESKYHLPKTTAREKGILKEKVERIRHLFPMQLVESEIK